LSASAELLVLYCKNDERLKTYNDDDDVDDDDYVTQVVQEYERAVIFRLGRLLSGGTKGPGSVSVCPRPTYDDARLTVIFRDKKPVPEYLHSGCYWS